MDPENNEIGTEWIPQNDTESSSIPEPEVVFEPGELGYASTSGPRLTIKPVNYVPDKNRRSLKLLLKNTKSIR
jgi:hypothetical protein